MVCRVFVIQAVIIGTVFLRMSDSTAAFFSRGGVIFLWALFPYSITRSWLTLPTLQCASFRGSYGPG